MKNMKKVVWGVVLLVVGAIFVLNNLNLTTINVWFPGWWTVFIIIPCGVGLITDRDKIGNAIGLGIGALLLLSAQGIIDFNLIWKLILPIIIIVVAIRMIVGGLKKSKDDREYVGEERVRMNADSTAIFSGCDVDYDGQVFEGTSLTAIFGGVDCDLRGAVIQRDCVIKVTAIFGGVEILLPKNVNVKVKTTTVFGGTDDNSDGSTIDGAPTVHITGACVFGGIDIE